MKSPLLAVDGDSFAHRAYHALPKSFRRADGRPANALTGFSRSRATRSRASVGSLTSSKS